MKVVVLNPVKNFNPYEQYLMVGTPSCNPYGRWLNLNDLSICRSLADAGHVVEYFDRDNAMVPVEEALAES